MSPRRLSEFGPARPWLIGLAAVTSFFLISVPVALIFAFALRSGVGVYFANILAPDTLHAVWLTVLASVVVVPINIAFGISAAWLIARFEFKGRQLLITIIELPFSISPIVAGVAYLFLYGGQGLCLFGPALQGMGIQLMFTVVAIWLVSLFVTAPFVARELIPLMQQQGSEEEEAALSLGANGWQMFTAITLPNIRWALLYGAILTNARVMGEFGAVSVVSGAIRGQTNTLPLQINLLFNDLNTSGAFAAASVLTLIAVLTIIAKAAVEGAQAKSHG